MLPASSVACQPRIIHQHTHFHSHVTRVRHVHHKAAIFHMDDSASPERGRARHRYGASRGRIASLSPVPASFSGKVQHFWRHRVVPALALLGSAIIFVLNRISFGFGFRVGYLPFLGSNRD
jgi:hypothetical protein